MGMRQVWGAVGAGVFAAGLCLTAALAAPADLAGCFSVEGPSGPPVVVIRDASGSWRGDFTSPAGSRRDVALDPDLHSTRVMLEANGRFLAVQQAFTVTASLTSRSDIVAALATPLVPPYRRDWGPAPFIYWAMDDDLLAAWKVECRE